VKNRLVASATEEAAAAQQVQVAQQPQIPRLRRSDRVILLSFADFLTYAICALSGFYALLIAYRTAGLTPVTKAPLQHSSVLIFSCPVRRLRNYGQAAGHAQQNQGRGLKVNRASWVSGRELPIPVPETQSAFHPLAQRNASVVAMRVCNAIDYAKFYGRSHDAVIRVYDDAGDVMHNQGQ
jgi:hypothetical protein